MITRRQIGALGLSSLLAACNRARVAGVYPTARSVRLFVRSDIPSKDYSVYRTVWTGPRDGYLLNPDQMRRLRSTLEIVPTPSSPPACFIPHHFFRFLDKDGRQIGEIQICFCCLGAATEPALAIEPGKMLSADYSAVERLVHELGAPTNVQCD